MNCPNCNYNICIFNSFYNLGSNILPRNYKHKYCPECGHELDPSNWKHIKELDDNFINESQIADINKISYSIKTSAINSFKNQEIIEESNRKLIIFRLKLLDLINKVDKAIHNLESTRFVIER